MSACVRAAAARVPIAAPRARARRCSFIPPSFAHDAHGWRSWPCAFHPDGALTGLNKKETVAEYGEEQVKKWRRSYSTPPPEIDTGSEHWPGNDNKYAHIPMEEIPLSECLKDTVDRCLPYWEETITPALTRGKVRGAPARRVGARRRRALASIDVGDRLGRARPATREARRAASHGHGCALDARARVRACAQTVLVAAHGNSIRGLLKYLDNISDEEITKLEIPTGVPLVYRLDKDLKPIPSGKGVRPAAAARAHARGRARRRLGASGEVTRVLARARCGRWRR